MNLIFDPWIPVITQKKVSKKVSLSTLFEDGRTFLDLDVRPQERIALMRFFVCIVHAATNGPKDDTDWEALPQIANQKVQQYFLDWQDSFELYHPTKPFLQLANLEPAKENAYTPISKLDFALASGSNSTLFDHLAEDRALEASEQALAMLVTQNFSTCGTLGMPLWNGESTAKSATDAPCATVSMYHLFVIGKNVLDTICLNVCPLNKLSRLYKLDASSDDGWLGRPAWEEMPKNAEDNAMTRTFLGRLVPVSRAIKMFPNRNVCLYGEALKYPAYPNVAREFNTSVAIRTVKKKEETLLVGIRYGVMPFREIPALVQYQSGNALLRAYNIDNARGSSFDLWVGGVYRNPGKQDILDVLESRFFIPKQYLSNIGYQLYKNGIDELHSEAKKITEFIVKYAKVVHPDKKPLNDDKKSSKSGKKKANFAMVPVLSQRTLSIFWRRMEYGVYQLWDAIKTLDEDEAGFETKFEAWKNMVVRERIKIVSQVCAIDKGLNIMAFCKLYNIKYKGGVEMDNIINIMDRLRNVKRKHDLGIERGILPRLKYARIPHQSHKSFPVLHKIGVEPGDTIAEFIVSCFASHPLDTKQDVSLGYACKAIQKKSGSHTKNTGFTTIEKLLMRIFDSSNLKVRLHEIYKIVALAETKQIAINYTRLYTDLHHWHLKTKQVWASEYYGTGESVEGKAEEQAV